jgi:hypothetical protein
MSNSETRIQNTQHAFLVAWGWFAEHLGLIQQLRAVSLKQKHYRHTPQTGCSNFWWPSWPGCSTCRRSAWQRIIKHNVEG